MVKFLIHRPIAVLMITMAMVILGLYAFNKIPVSLMPDVAVPEITIKITENQLSARQMENGVIRSLRTSLYSVGHLKDIKSVSSNGSGLIYLKFNHGTNIDYAFIEVNEKIDRVMGNLPRNLKRPRVIKASISDIPVFYLNLTLKQKNTLQKNNIPNNNLYPVGLDFVDFSRFTNQVISKRITQLSEVAMVDISGVVDSEILIIPDQEKLQSLHIGLWEIESVINQNNLEIGNLLVHDSQYQYSIRLGNNITTIEDLRNIYLEKGDRIFQLKELANIIIHPQSRTGLFLSENREGVTMSIIKQHSAKMVDLKESLNRLLGYLKNDYPEIEFTITRDQTNLLDYAINNMLQSLFWGILLAFGIMFLFLKNIKSPLLIGITIPVSLIVCLLFFQILDISINIISLSGLVLGIGLMIDNSIIVIDNITQYRERGYALSDACVQGTKEVFRPLLSSMLTTCAVFLPLIFISGITGALFYDQAMSISIGLVISLLVSITLLPVLYRLFYLREGRLTKRITAFLEKLNKVDYASKYKIGFRWVMRHQKTSWSITLLLLLAGVILFGLLPRTQLPYFTKTESLITIDWNEAINVEENKKRIIGLLAPFEKRLKTQTVLVGSQQFLLKKGGKTKASESSIYLQTQTPEELDKVLIEIKEKVQTEYPRALISQREVDNIFSLIFSDKEATLIARLRSTENLGDYQNEALKEVWFQLQQDIAEISLQKIAWEDQVVLTANHEKLLTYNINPNTLINKLKSAFKSYHVLEIIDSQDFIPIVLGEDTKSVEQILSESLIKGKNDVSYSIRDFIKVRNIRGLKTITGGKEGEYYPIEMNISAEQTPKMMDRIKETVGKNKWYEVSFSGSFFNDEELMGELISIMVISLLLLYFILASQFESFVLPLIILLEVPLDLAGAFLFLKLFGMSINLMSMIGIVVMSGIIINDSILKIDTVIQLQRQGYGLLKALLVAGQRRLKPILMTSLTTILALTPLLFKKGLGAELQAPLAVAIIGGMLFGTIVSLYFIPLCYYYLTKK